MPRSPMRRRRLPKKRSRVDVARELPQRPQDAARKTALLWLVIAGAGVALTLAGLAAAPLLVIGAIFILVSLPMAAINFRRSRTSRA